jgi:hypothetical protein
MQVPVRRDWNEPDNKRAVSVCPSARNNSRTTELIYMKSDDGIR